VNFTQLITDMEKVGLVLALLAFLVGLFHLIEIRRVMRDAKALAGEAKAHTTELLKHSAALDGVRESLTLQATEAKIHADALQTQTSALDEVRGSLSTRYVGQFPEYYPEIVELLNRAKREIVIFCDFPAYASFTDPQTWLDYEQTLERKTQREGVTLSLTCLNQRNRSMALQEQFFDPQNDWNAWKEDENEKLRRFLSSRRGARSVDELTKEEFVKMLEAVDRHSLEDTFERADVRQLDCYIPIFFWLTDGIRAVFAIPGSAQRAVEYGFSTTDQKLISAFLDMREHYNCAHHFPTPEGTSGTS
jgi:hypothetical protein